ncbi:MAG TPA: hypothetical protein ENI26_12925 [Methylophaga aminisulfidivorans]|uniref:Uncharacterized protein n=2 Tax=root TaxID=1 RepID=A0A7C2ACR0_9GAMM|nr:hypothetical protein [Methylophaga aminisulfidivorans]
MKENNGLLASICGFFKSLFSSSPSQSAPRNNQSNSTAAKTNDGLTGVERYIRSQANSGSQLTGVEKYIRNQVTTQTVLTGVEKYIRNKTQPSSMTGVELYIQNNG